MKQVVPFDDRTAVATQECSAAALFANIVLGMLTCKLGRSPIHMLSHLHAPEGPTWPPHLAPNTSQQLPLLNLYLCGFAAQALSKPAITKTSAGKGAVTVSKAAAQGRIGTAQRKQPSAVTQKVSM